MATVPTGGGSSDIEYITIPLGTVCRGHTAVCAWVHGFVKVWDGDGVCVWGEELGELLQCV